MVEIRDIKKIDQIHRTQKGEPVKKDKQSIQNDKKKSKKTKVDDDNDEQHVDEFV